MNLLNLKTALNCLLTLFFIESAQAIPDAELNSFGHHLESSLNNGNPYFFNRSFDLNGLLESLYLRHPEMQDSEYNTGFSEGIQHHFDLGSMITHSLQYGGSITYLHALKENNGTQLCFRLIGASGIDYYLFKLTDKDKYMVITDMYLASKGEWISQTIEENYQQHRPDLRKTESIRESEAPQTLQNLNHKRKFRAAWKEWKQLPYNMQVTKSSLCAALMCTGNLSHADFIKGFAQWNKHYPQEPSKYLIPLNKLIEHKAYSLALAYTDSLSASVGSDPALLIFRADILHRQGNEEEATRELSRLIETDPQFQTGYIALLEYHLKAQRFREATELLDRMTLEFNAYKNELLPLVANHRQFIKSDVYRHWILN